MLTKRRTSLLLVFIAVFIVFEENCFSRPLRQEETVRLYEAIKPRSAKEASMDILVTEEVLISPQAAQKARAETAEQNRILREKANNDSITLVSVDIDLTDGGKVRLSETRTRMSGGKIRHDTTVFANLQKTETYYEATKINTGLDKESPSYEIDHKLKQVWIRNDRRWSGYNVLQFGRIPTSIVRDIASLYSPRQQKAKTSAAKRFTYKRTHNIASKIIDEIECIDNVSGKIKYSIFVDANDWRQCHKIEWYDDDLPLVSKITEYKKFELAADTDKPFPRQVIHRHFDKEGKEEKLETINITSVTVGLPISDEVFKLNTPPDYTKIDYRFTPHKPAQPLDSTK